FAIDSHSVCSVGRDSVSSCGAEDTSEAGLVGYRVKHCTVHCKSIVNNESRFL
ncbi:hypothetical protein PISMIDRAFT_670410, partial [Pisolithus microcarpus 441]